jgi:cysteinyl-tRNA synthetase
MAKSSGNVVLLTDDAGRGYDPLAVRMAFLEQRYRQQMNLTWAGIAAADRTLNRWRQRVADWAESPSAPMAPGYGRSVYEAFADDLDTATALQTLRRIERDPELAPGAKFELFAHLDRLFGLDLARDVGKPRGPAVLSAEISTLLEARAAARAAKDWGQSDRLRDELATRGVTVVDTPEGQRVS